MSAEVIPIRREFVDEHGIRWVWNPGPQDHHGGVIPCPGAVEPLRLPPRPGRKAEMMRLGIRLFGALLTVALLLVCGTASAQEDVAYQSSNVAGSGGTGWQGFSPTWVPSLVTWVQADLGMTAAMSPVTATGTTPPTITLSGTPTGPQAAAATPYIEIDCTTLGALGTSKFTFKVNGTTTATNVASSASPVAITGSPISAAWAIGASATNDVYTASVVASAIADQSTTANNYSQATGSKQPTWALGFNGRSAVSFVEAKLQVLTASKASNTILTGTSAEEILIGKAIADPTSPGTNGLVDAKWGTAVVGNYAPFSDGSVYSDFGSTTRQTASGHAAGAMAQPFVLDLYSAASDWRAFLNGNQFFSTGTNTVGFNASVALLGESYSNAYGSMTVAAVMVASSKLDPALRSKLVSYYGNYYGIAVKP